MYMTSAIQPSGLKVGFINKKQTSVIFLKKDMSILYASAKNDVILLYTKKLFLTAYKIELMLNI